MMQRLSPNLKIWALALLVAAVTVAVYWQTGHFGFVNLDDPEYITDNSHVKAGLTLEGVRWAFTTVHGSNWFPLTWLSHLLAVQLFGLHAGAHHLINVLFHVANSILLLLVLCRLTGAPWRSMLVAVLFAIHPMHVESVAWVTERKDVLSTFFWMLTMLAYCRQVEYPGRGRYLLVLAAFTCGLMTKPMLVTLPFVLLLLDYWPLRRLAPPGVNRTGNAAAPSVTPARLVYEKAPLFALSAASCAITFFAQQRGGSVSTLEKIPFQFNIANAFVSYARYLGKMFWPKGLAAFYPFDFSLLNWWRAGGALLLLLGLSVAAYRLRRKAPFLITGWLWFLGTMVPVIGVIQVGSQAMADRYTYIPYIGLFIVLSWSLGEIAGRLPAGRLLIPAVSVVCVVILSIATWGQVKTWQNDFTLFNHALTVTDNNYLAHNNLGIAYLLAERGATDSTAMTAPTPGLTHAMQQFSEAVRIKPDYADGLVNLGVTYCLVGDLNNAIISFQKSLLSRPDDARTRDLLDKVLKESGTSVTLP